MNDYVYPWRLIPNKRHQYPGGREIDRFRGVFPAQDDNHPEAWIGSTISSVHPSFPMDGFSECLRPSGSLCYLVDAIRESPHDMIGPTDRLSLLVKLLDAKEQLAFQCHPSREVARRLFGSDFGKAEAWVVIGLREDVSEPPYMLLGFKEGISRDLFESLYQSRDFKEIDKLAHKIPVSVGDVFFVGPGVPHAIGPGCFVVEIQEPSDLTVGCWIPANMNEQQRILHEARVMESFDFTGYSSTENLLRCQCNPQIIRRGAWGTEELLIGPSQTTYFSCSRLQATSPVAWRKTGRAVICIVMEGDGSLIHGDTITSLKKSDELFIPANVHETLIQPGENGITLMLAHPEGASHGMI